jgi:hypothetical protein
VNSERRSTLLKQIDHDRSRQPAGSIPTSRIIRPRDRFNGNRPSQHQRGGPQRSQTFDSHGPGERVRGRALQIYERYLALARDAARGEDRIASENYYQYAEHYFRVNNASGDRHSQETARQIEPAPIETGIATAELSELELDREQPRANANSRGFEG